MRILITGADGFIGSHLTELLLKKKYKIRALSLYNSFDFNGWLENIKHKNLEIIKGDIRDSAFCEMLTKNIDIVINLAALISIPYSYGSVESFVDTNIKGTLNICLACKKNKVKKLVQFSTSEVYGSAKYTPIDEEHPLQPQSPYSATKIGSDALALSFHNSYDLNVTVARPFNTYGPRQSQRAIIPTIISQIMSGKKKIKLGSIHTRRDLTFVEDLCFAIYLIIKNYKKFGGEVFNIGSNNSITVKAIFDLLNKIFKKNCEIVFDKKRIRPKKSEVNTLVCDNKKFYKTMNFKPNTNLENGLLKTIKWFEDNKDKIKRADLYHF